MNRYRKFVYKDEENGIVFSSTAKEGLTFELVDGEEGEMVIRVVPVETANIYSNNYNNPPIPEGYKHIYGTVSNGFVIERCSDGSIFTWVPVGMLDDDGTLDGMYYIEKFGRRNFMKDVFSSNEIGYSFICQVESVKKYGGFYISSCNISMNAEGKPQSVRGAVPWTNISFEEANRVAAEMEDTESVKSHLIYGAEYDSTISWFIKSNARSFEEMTKDSTKLGNYWNAKDAPREITGTGSNEKWCTNNIFDLPGNVDEWTQERSGPTNRVVRGGSYISYGMNYPAAYRTSSKTSNQDVGTGFRVALYIE